MNPSDSLDNIYRRFIAEEGRIENELEELSARTKGLQDRLEDLRTLRLDTEHLLRERGLFPILNAGAGEAAAAPKAAPRARAASAAPKAAPASEKKSDTAAAPAPTARTAAAPATRRKGRRKRTEARKRKDSAYNDLGIVDAAVRLAQEKGVEEADAGMVRDWFQEVGYETRNGTPTRNSIYVSLNREHTYAVNGTKTDVRVRHTGERGRFRFDLGSDKATSAQSSTPAAKPAAKASAKVAVRNRTRGKSGAKAVTKPAAKAGAEKKA